MNVKFPPAWGNQSYWFPAGPIFVWDQTNVERQLVIGCCDIGGLVGVNLIYGCKYDCESMNKIFNNNTCPLIIKRFSSWSYLCREIDKIIGMICEKKFEGWSAKVVASQMDFLKLMKGKFKIDSLAIYFVAQSRIPKTDPTSGYFYSPFDYGHERDQFALLACRHLFFTFAQFLFPKYCKRKTNNKTRKRTRLFSRKLQKLIYKTHKITIVESFFKNYF